MAFLSSRNSTLFSWKFFENDFFYLPPTLPPCQVVKNQELSLESGVQLASSLALIIARGLCVSGHVIRTSLPAIRL